MSKRTISDYHRATHRTYIVATDCTDYHCDIHSAHSDLDEAEAEALSLRPGIVQLGVITDDVAEGERIRTDNVHWL